MADGYIDRQYVADSLGGGWTGSVANAASVELMITQATANVSDDVAALGYAAPTLAALAALNVESDMPKWKTYNLLRSATLGYVMSAMSFVPEARVELGQSWQSHPAVVALEKLRAVSDDDRGPRLELALDTTAAVGGVSVSEASPTVSISEGSNPARTTRLSLGVW